MNYSIIEGCIRQSTQNKIMDKQIENNYIILKNGKRTEFKPRSLPQAVQLIRQLEENFDRYNQHSPYTIGKADAN
tara:strand:- start:89 stop:313 length:225 start_codon:yes stop_codon:yes gene_type:complete